MKFVSASLGLLLSTTALASCDYLSDYLSICEPYRCQKPGAIGTVAHDVMGLTGTTCQYQEMQNTPDGLQALVQSCQIPTSALPDFVASLEAADSFLANPAEAGNPLMGTAMKGAQLIQAYCSSSLVQAIDMRTLPQSPDVPPDALSTPYEDFEPVEIQQGAPGSKQFKWYR